MHLFIVLHWNLEENHDFNVTFHRSKNKSGYKTTITVYQIEKYHQKAPFLLPPPKN